MIKRIKTDVKLRRCEIATVGIRRASRHKVTEIVEVFIDEHPAVLVVWTHFELPVEGPRYRAGIEFVTSASEMVERFISTISNSHCSPT